MRYKHNLEQFIHIYLRFNDCSINSRGCGYVEKDLFVKKNTVYRAYKTRDSTYRVSSIKIIIF